MVDGVRTNAYTAAADASADLAAINALIVAGAFMQLPVHRGILFGMEAMIKLNQDGISDMPKIIVKSLGSSGVGDPLDQRQSLGFKVDGFGLAIKRPEAICITFGIPKYAEMAALTDQYITGEYTLMDSLNPDAASTDANRVNALGEGVLRVDGVNSDTIVPLSPFINGAGVYPVFAIATDYAIGDTVLYEGIPYVFIATHAAAAWDRTDVAQVKVSLEDNLLANEGNDPTSNIK